MCMALNPAIRTTLQKRTPRRLGVRPASAVREAIGEGWQPQRHPGPSGVTFGQDVVAMLGGERT